MNEKELEQLRFPIGKFNKPENFTREYLESCISVIENFPNKLNIEIKNLSEDQLDTPYRENGWTIRQVIHHCADSHITSITRFKLALTEENPSIKPYFEDKFAELADSKNFPIEASLQMLEGTHKRWTALLKSLTEQDLEKTFIHPEHNKEFTLKENIGIYAWHCQHHLAHITSLKKKMNW